MKAIYRFPVLLGFDRIPEDCLVPGCSLSFQVCLRIDEDAWAKSKPVKVGMPLTFGGQ